MSLADDLRAAAVDHAAIAIAQAVAGNGGVKPERLAQAAVDVAAPFLIDAQRVEDALAARERTRDDPATRRTRPLPRLLWERAGQHEHRYLELMQQHGWLTLDTIYLASSGNDAGGTA